jgi:hypothetical protein
MELHQALRATATSRYRGRAIVKMVELESPGLVSEGGYDGLAIVTDILYGKQLIQITRLIVRSTSTSCPGTVTTNRRLSSS